MWGFVITARDKYACTLLRVTLGCWFAFRDTLLLLISHLNDNEHGNDNLYHLDRNMNLKHGLAFMERKCVPKITQVSSAFIYNEKKRKEKKTGRGEKKNKDIKRTLVEFSGSGKRLLLS